QSCSIIVTQDANLPNLVCGVGANLTCTLTSVQICSSADPGVTFLWSGPGIVGSNTGTCVTVNAAGTYSVIATKTSSGCTQSCSIIVTQDANLPNLVCGAGANLTCTITSASICATATASTFVWSGPGIVGSTTGSCITVNAPG